MKAILAVLAVIGMAVGANEASANGGAFQRQVVVRRVVQQPVRVVHQPVVVRQVHAVNAGCFGGGYGVQSFAAPCATAFGGSCGVNAFNSFGYGGNAFGFQRQRFINGSLFSPFGFNRGFGFGRGLSLNFGF